MSEVKAQATLLLTGESLINPTGVKGVELIGGTGDEAVVQHQDIVATLCANGESFIKVGEPGELVEIEETLAAQKAQCEAIKEPYDHYDYLRFLNYNEDFGMPSLEAECVSGKKWMTPTLAKFPYSDENSVIDVMKTLAYKINNNCRIRDNM